MRQKMGRGAKKLVPDVLFLLGSLGFLCGTLWAVRHFGLTSEELRTVILLVEFWIIWAAFFRFRLRRR